MLFPLIELQVVSPDTVEHPPVVAAALLEAPEAVPAVVMLTEAQENQFLVATKSVHPSVGQVKVGTVKVI